MGAYPFSYSSLNSYETCPRRFCLTRVTKEVVEPQGEYLVWGNKVHNALELRVRDKKPLPAGMEQFEKYAQPFDLAQSGKVVETETKYALTRNLTPCKWTDKSAWVRGIIDLNVVNLEKKKAAAFDWKTGKVREESDQLKLFAGLLMQAKTWLKKVKTGFIWLNHDKITAETYTRDDLPAIWEDFTARSRKMEQSFITNKWLPKPSGLCRAHCPVPYSLCEFSGKT